MNHDRLIEAFHAIQDKNALAWSILDTKSELAISLAIVLSANRKASKRIAYVEHKRVDICFVNEDSSFTFYEAKAAYLTDFQQKRVDRNDKWLGKCVNDDLLKLKNISRSNPNIKDYACLFYLYENSKPHRQAKYGKPPVALEKVLEAVNKLVVDGVVVSHQVIDCGIADEAEIKVHLVIFEPR